jgi:hypothetical protein
MPVNNCFRSLFFDVCDNIFSTATFVKRLCTVIVCTVVLLAFRSNSLVCYVYGGLLYHHACYW